MIGFHLSINKNANDNIELVSIPYASLPDLNTLGRGVLYIFDDDRAQLVQSKECSTFNIGTLVYKKKWQKKALELIIRDLNNGKTVREIMPDTRGQFCFIIHTNGSVFVITDKLGSFPIYKYEDTNTIQISNVFLSLAKHNSVTVNHQAFAEYLSFDYCFDCTFFNEIELLDRGSIYQFTPTLKVQAYDDFPSDIIFNKYNNIDEVSCIATEILKNNLSFLSLSDRVFVDITGGFDTRTIATILKSMNIDFEAGICGEQNLGESKLAERVANELCVKFSSNTNITDRHLFNDILDRHFTISTGVPILYHSTELINYYERIKQDFDIHITGFAGSQLFDQFLPRLSLFSPKLKHKHIFEKSFKFKNIFKSNLLTETSYYETLSKKISKLLKQIGSDVHDEAASFFTLSTFNKYYHGSLAGTHNMIMPFYCPYLEGNIVKLMVETSYKLKQNRTIQRAMLTKLNQPISLIMTSHGYSANVESKETKSTLRSCRRFAKSFLRQLFYELGFPIKLMWYFQNYIRRFKPQIDTAELQRSFWIGEINKVWSDGMEIFALIDKSKLNLCFANEPYISKLKAKIIYLNRILDECNPKL